MSSPKEVEKPQDEAHEHMEVGEGNGEVWHRPFERTVYSGGGY